MKMYKYEFRFKLFRSSIVASAIAENVGEALNKAIKEFELENETFSVVVIPLGAVKGSYVDVVA